MQYSLYYRLSVFFFNDTATPEIYTDCHTLSLTDARPISPGITSSLEPKMSSVSQPPSAIAATARAMAAGWQRDMSDFPLTTPGLQEARRPAAGRSEEHTSELQSLMRISYAVFCLKKNTRISQTLNYRPYYFYLMHS